jgi:hypothetical protein
MGIDEPYPSFAELFQDDLQFVNEILSRLCAAGFGVIAGRRGARSDYLTLNV